MKRIIKSKGMTLTLQSVEVGARDIEIGYDNDYHLF